MLLALAGLLVVRAPAADGVHPVTGVVRQAIDADGYIRIAHDNIPGVMPAMTMAFRVARPAEAARLVADDRVRFELHTAGDDWFATAFVVIGSSAPAPAATEAAPRRRVREGDAMPEFSLLNQDGAPLSLAALRGHATIVTFIFTRCPVPEYCPALAFRFAELQKAILTDDRLHAQARLLSITLDPTFDRPAVLKSYGEAVGADLAVWQFATGTPAEIAALTKAFAVFTERNGLTLDHTLCTVLIGPDGTVRQIWRGNGWKTPEVIAAVKAVVGS
ncbi:SCO family protein [Horticoccus luteus]|uniref:SCO family protein n=1 Tax=Horticoccus luteus TaxID=2862869 RepID=A0A8F9XJN8_9BACT|nr:SCO family protein [Horticoccus luteus]QYM78863.1 SCO family protein [Horticoccus luteus]